MELDSFNGTTHLPRWPNGTDLWSFIEENRGIQRRPLIEAIPLTVINSVIFISGITGNVGVCIVIRKNAMLHTATHYFLFNLAVADLLLLIFGLPNDVAHYWHQYPWVLGVFFCKLRALISEMASYVSVMTIVVFSTERYLAICHPLHRHTLSGLSRAVYIIGGLWFVAFAAAMPFYQMMDIHYINYPNSSGIVHIQESAICEMIEIPENVPLFELSFGIFFVLPLIVILTQYIKMSSSIAESEKPLNGLCGSINGNRLRRRAQSNKSINRMLLAVVVGFFCCWAPFHAQRLVIIYASKWEYIGIFDKWMFFITGIFYYFSSTLNPILYNIMSRKMRTSFRQTFQVMCFNKKLSRNSNMSNSTVYGRRSRSFSENTQHTCYHKTSVKQAKVFDDESGMKKRYDLISSHYKNESIV